MRVSRANCRYNALTYPGKDSVFPCPTHESIDVRTDRDTSNGNELDPILRHGRDLRCVYDLRVHRYLNSLKDVSASQIDRRSLVEREFDVGFVCTDQCTHYPVDAPAGQVMCLKLISA
ncbi:uncharacterized protein METZ01_LOCUS377011 [marine metagenome]|uniref:Uncharacterized protein n=1 Tax=marine metagenome TaxID=408172 RepID=A0A382TRG9_9ZZZZ